jgi:TRAP-type mannitol/chloroaromatic compound transport system permease small subunit
MHGLFRAVDRLNQFVGLSVAHLYLICAGITAYEVVMRYFFNAPTQWAFEVVMVVCASAWVMSGGYISMRRGHIAITVLYDHIQGRRRWWLDLFIMVVTVISLAIFIYSLWHPMVDALQATERSGTSFNSPEPYILKTLLWVGAVLYFLQAVVNLLKHFYGEGVPKSSELPGD